MNFSEDHLKELIHFPLEKSDKVQVINCLIKSQSLNLTFLGRVFIPSVVSLYIKEYIEDLTKKIEIGKDNEPYVSSTIF